MIKTNNNTPLRDGVEENGECSRRNSGSSQMSSSTSPNYDSGNVSDLNLSLRPASFSSTEDDSLSNEYGQHNKFQHILREKDQSLFLALQDVRRLKSELERLSKSEKWYKSELRTQKNSRMEILEKLYTNERKFTQENQRLQNECVALYTRCSEIENQLREKKEITKNILKSSSKPVSSSEGVLIRDFELEQHQQKLADQEQLIEILRNQKRSLLKDLQKLSCEKDEIVLQLQTTVAQLEDENRTITKRCMQLVEAKVALKDELSAKETDCSGLSNEVLDLQITVKSLQEKLHAHITELNQKELEVDSLRRELSQRDQTDEIAALVEKRHQQELSEKEESIRFLNEITVSLKNEILSMEDLRTRYDEQQQVLSQIRHDLEERSVEVENLKASHEILLTQSGDLPSNHTPVSPEDFSLLEENKKLHQQNVSLQKELESKLETSSHSLELNHLRKAKQELDQILQKYLEVCKLYEKSKFESDMKDITVERFKFEKEKDKREIEILRQKLVEVSNKFECQKSLATEFEFALARAQQEKRRLEGENKYNVDKSLKLKGDLERSKEMSDEKDMEIEKLKAELFEVNDKLNKHKAVVDSNDLSTLLCEKNSSEKRVELIQRLLSLQSNRMLQLNAEQAEWQNLLVITKSDVAVIEADTDDSEFDDLNQLFEEQNLELQQINESYRQQSINLRQTLQQAKEESYAFQRELEVAKAKIVDLETQVNALEIANSDYQKEIAHLAGTNERLIEEFNQDFSQEREYRNKQVKQLQLENKNYAAENVELKEKVQVLQSEVNQLSLNNQKLCLPSDSEPQGDDPVKEKILQNVLEKEYRRKMSRYDVHIRSLLSNVKSYKRNLETAENRYTALLAKSKDMIEPEELSVMENNLKDMRRQFETSQKEINDLRHQLKTVREQFSVADAGKTSSTMDLTNLMDDYKKLIQQSQIETKRLSTSEIYDLINRSNNCVPKLTNISTSVDGLRTDVQKIRAVMSQGVPAGRASPQPKMSLMDELKLAEHAKMC